MTLLKKSEDQNTEFKESWRDDQLKTICAFANTKGGRLYLGVDDNGFVKGVKDSAKHLEDIPSKIKEILGLIPDVQLKKSKGKEYIEIKIKSCDSPISYRGKYYIRSGSTTQELNNSELQRFLLAKNNMSWESIYEENVSLEDINTETVELFKTRANTKQLPASKEKNLDQLLSKLHLQVKGKLVRAAVLLFSKDPQHYYTGSYTKIGRFSNDEILQSSDEIKGNLFEQAERTMEVLKNKYLSSEIQIEGLYRNENLEYPESALREAIINAIAHKDYSGPHIQIKVYPDRLVFWNPGELPKDLTIESLKKKHPSFPRNKRIADVFYASGLIEAWGSGTMKMIRDCVKSGLPEPIFEESDGGILVTFSKDIYTEQFLKGKGLNERQIIGINHLKIGGTIHNAKYQALTNTTKRTASRDLTELLDKKVIEKTGSTGKGTTYKLLGQTTIPQKTTSPINTQFNELDKKLMLLDKALEVFDPEEEIKLQFSRELFLKIFDSWFMDLLLEVIPVIQKFNRYFINPGHYVNLPNGTAYIMFANEDPKEIISNLKEQLIKNAGQLIRNEISSSISTFYGSFRKAGLDTFGANYSIEIKFDLNWYEITMDDGVMNRNKTMQFRRQYHKPLLKSEARGLANRFGDLIYMHISEMILKISTEKDKGVTKGTKEP